MTIQLENLKLSIQYPIRKLRQAQNRKNFNIFWNKLSQRDRERVILLIGIDKKPVPSLTHLKCMLLLVKNCYDEKWTYGRLEQ